jgi:peptidoglycan/xylan/chitin deacetylase (PgdA/CDA1 family)
LTRVPRDVAESEILESKLAIEREIGEPVRTFAYPNGQPGDFDEETQGLVESLGFEAALTTISGPVDDTAQPFSLNRMDLSCDEMPIFKAKLAGLFNLLRPMKRFLGI